MNGRSVTCQNGLILLSFALFTGFCSTSQRKFAMIFFVIDDGFWWCFIYDDAMIFYDIAWYCNLIAGKTLISQLEKDLPNALFPPSLKSESSSSKTCFYCTIQSLTMDHTFLIGVQADLLCVRVQKIKTKAFSMYLTVLSRDSFHSHSNSISQNPKLFCWMYDH